MQVGSFPLLLGRHGRYVCDDCDERRAAVQDRCAAEDAGGMYL